MPNVYEELENGTYRKNNGSTVKSKPERGFLKYYTNDDKTPYFVNIVSGESVWELPRNRANSCAAKDAEIAELKAKLAACGPATAPAAVAANAAAANNAYTSYRKMLKMRQPEGAVRQKMAMAGISQAAINAFIANPSAAAPSAPAAEAVPVRPMGGPAFLAGIGAAKLKKVNAPAEKSLAPEPPKKTGAAAAAASIAEEAQRKAQERAQRATMSVEERLAAAKAAREAEAATATKTGFGAFAAELKQRAAPKTGAPAAPIAKRQVLNANNAGPLPKGWKYVIDEDGDMYYVKSNGTSQWNRPSEGGRRRASRKNRRSNRRTRRN